MDALVIVYPDCDKKNKTWRYDLWIKLTEREKKLLAKIKEYERTLNSKAPIIQVHIMPVPLWGYREEPPTTYDGKWILHHRSSTEILMGLTLIEEESKEELLHFIKKEYGKIPVIDLGGCDDEDGGEEEQEEGEGESEESGEGGGDG